MQLSALCARTPPLGPSALPNAVPHGYPLKDPVLLTRPPATPTGAVTPSAGLKDLADLCRRRSVLFVSDEIYRAFTYDAPPATPATDNPDAVVVEGFGKTYGVTGWRLGFAHGPK